MKNVLFFTIFIISLLIWQNGAEAQPSPGKDSLRVEFSADRDKITIGDLITLTVEVKTPPQWIVKNLTWSHTSKILRSEAQRSPLYRKKRGRRALSVNMK